MNADGKDMTFLDLHKISCEDSRNVTDNGAEGNYEKPRITQKTQRGEKGYLIFIYLCNLCNPWLPHSFLSAADGKD